MRSTRILIVEGIFALTPSVVDIFRRFGNLLQVVVQPILIVNLDELHYIPTQKLLVIRRIVRDSSHRGRDGRETLTMWENVIEGEHRNWFPVLPQSDVIFNALRVYELGALKASCEMILRHIDPSYRSEYKDASQILSLLRWVHGVPGGRIPKQSIIHEILKDDKEREN